LIAGGCGLNCEWNSRWKECGLFADVFVPPCANDSGSAIGVAIDAQHQLTGSAKVDWSVYSGEEFVLDAEPDGFRKEPLDLEVVAGALADGKIVAWAQGRYEIGPRALGHRSILAAPFEATMTERLNAIKQREDYRPIAPVCREEDVGRWFDSSAPSPHMLYFTKVRDRRLRAVTHVDGTARVQTISRGENDLLHRLLGAFEARTGVSVLCNTSLNFNGMGFINRRSHLANYARQRGLDAMVVGDSCYWREGA
jgi:hydroxymethyl cephem carbamoyltransferase